MKTSVEPLEGNKVKLSVEVDEGEFERALDAAFRKIAREVRIPGFRPGKAPRRILEARIGVDAARQEALRDALPDYYAQAVKEHDVDVIAAPEIDITAGEEQGAVAFDAVVEVRPRITVPGYAGIQVTIPSPVVTDEEVDRQVDRLRNGFAELQAVGRPARDGDVLTIDLKGTRHDEVIDGLEVTDFSYELGSGGIVPELDEQLQGTKAGDIIKFNAAFPGQDEDVTFQVLVKDVKEKLLPEPTDEWASEASEFETIAELRDDLRTRIAQVKRVQANLALRDAAVQGLVELVDEDPPEALVGDELNRRIHDLGHRLEHQGASLAQYLQATGMDQDQLLAQLREASVDAVKADLALRAVADAEGIEADDEDVDAEVERLADQVGQKPAQVRRQLERQEQLPAVRSDIRKGKALEWLVEHVELVDEEGHAIDRADLELPKPDAERPAAEQETEESE